jgi:hypothetical protein
MTNKEYTIDNLKQREKEILEELDFNSSSELENELYEIKDTLKQLKVYE